MILTNVHKIFVMKRYKSGSIGLNTTALSSAYGIKKTECVCLTYQRLGHWH